MKPKFLPPTLAALALVVTGCPRDQYIVELKPLGDALERTLTFYRADGVNGKTGAPNYSVFDADELAAIAALYPAQSLTNDGERHIVRASFAREMPSDVGCAGAYKHLSTSLGEAGFYEERFRGNDDMAGIILRRFKAADRLTDMMLGWSQMELGHEQGYGKLRQFLDADLRRDLKNLGEYWQNADLAGQSDTNADEEFAVRFGQYLAERGYFTAADLPGLFTELWGNDTQGLLRRIQRLAARKMGTPETSSVPASLAVLGDAAALQKSFDKYAADTDAYRAKLKQWEEAKKLKPDTKKPEPLEVAGDAFGDLVNIEFNFGDQPDHLAVRLSLPSPPLHSNGKWDDARKEVVWETDLAGRTNAFHAPFSCYANWTKANEEYQIKHFGKVALTDDDLTQYCLWRNAQTEKEGGEWDALMDGLRPGPGLAEKLAAFRFSEEPPSAGTNSPEKSFSPSAYPRELLKTALKGNQ